MIHDRTVSEVKRMIGTNGQVELGKRHFPPGEISSMILSYVRNYARNFINEDISRAVISVPAYFDGLQRQETLEAGRMAGFMVDCIINGTNSGCFKLWLGAYGRGKLCFGV